jgi:hypothetical protein
MVIMRLEKPFNISLITIILSMLYFAPNALLAQNNLENNVKIILSDQAKGVDYLKGYTQPLTTSFGVIMGGSLFHSADINLIPHLDIGLSFYSIKMPDKAKSFYWQGESVPTFFGNADPPEGAVRGTELKKLLIPQLQLNLGLFTDFELMLRGNPSYKSDEIGEITIYGVGIKYGLSDLVSISGFELALSAQAAYHIMRVSNWLNTGTFSMNVQASKNLLFLPIGFYTGVGYDATSMTMSIDEISGIGDNARDDVRLNGENGLRVLIGMSINIYFLSIHLDYNINEYNSIGGGIKLVF